MTAGNQPLSSGSVDALMHAIDSPTVMALAQVFRQPNGVLNRSYSEQIVEILAPRLNGAAQGVLDRGDVARVICCGSTGCQFVGDSEDGSKCYCDTSDFHGSGVERKTGAILALSAVTPCPGPGDRKQAYETVRHIIGHLEGNCGLSFSDVTQDDWDILTNLVASPAAEIERLRAALAPFAGEKLPSSRRSEIAYNRDGLRCAMSPLQIAQTAAYHAMSPAHRGDAT